MNSVNVREYLRRHVLGLLAIFIALSGTAIAAGDGPSASTSAVTTAKFKKLKQRVLALERRGTAPSGPARGDLTGNYPNPRIATNAVTTDKIAANAVTTDKIADGTIGIADVGASTHLLCLAGFQYVQGACIQTTARPQQNYTDARTDCAIVSGRVATLAELETFKRSGGTISGTEYTLNPTGATSAITYDNSANIGVEANTANAHQFHCVLNPTG